MLKFKTSFLLVLRAAILWGCWVGFVHATQYTAVLNGTSPSWADGLPYQIYPIYLDAGSTLGVSTTSNTLSGTSFKRPWYAFYDSFNLSSMGSNTIMDTSVPSSNYPGLAYSGADYVNSSGQHIYPDNFTYLISRGAIYTLLVSPSQLGDTGTIIFTLTGDRPFLNVLSGSQTFSGSFINPIKLGAGTAVVEGGVSGTINVNQGMLDFGTAGGNASTVSGSIIIGTGSMVRLQNLTSNTFAANISSTSSCSLVNNINGLNVSGSITGSGLSITLNATTSFLLASTISADSLTIINNSGKLTVYTYVTGNNFNLMNNSGATAILDQNLSGSGINCTNTGGTVRFLGNIDGLGAVISNASSGNMTISGGIGAGASISNDATSNMTLSGNVNAANIGITNAGSLTVSGSFVPTGTSFLTQTGGSLVLTSGSVVIPVWNLSGGSVSASVGTLNISATSVLGNGTSGAIITNSKGGTVNVAATTINNTTFANTNGALTISGNMGDNNTLNNGSSSTMTISGVTGGANIGITNAGTLNIANSFTGTGTSFLTQTGGSLNISNNIAVPTWNLFGGNVTNSSAGTLSLGSTSALGNGTSGPTITNSSGGTINVAAITINNTTFTNTSGTLAISGNMGNNNTLNNSVSATMTISGATNGANIGITNAGILNISNSFAGTGTSFLTQTSGTFNLSSNDVSIPTWSILGGYLFYSGNGVLNLSAASTLGNGVSHVAVANTGGGTLNVAATTIKYTTLTNSNGTLVISGVLDDSNTLTNGSSSTMTLSGTTSGANINISNSGTATLSGNVTGTGNSSINQRGGTLNVSGNFVMPTWNLYGGTMTFTGNAKAYAPSQVTFYLGDGNAQGISPVTTGKIVVAGSGNTFSPGVVNVALDNTTIVNASDLVDASQTNRSWTLIEGVTNTPVLGVVPSVGGIFTWDAQKVGNNYVVSVVNTSLTQANTVVTTTETIDVGGDSIREVSTNVAEVNSTQFRSFASHAKSVMQQMFWSKSNRSEPLSMDSLNMDSINKPTPIQLTPQASDSHVYVSGIQMRGKTDAIRGSDASSDMQSGMIMGMDHTFKKSQTYVWGYVGGTVGLLEVIKDRSNKSTSKTMLAGVNVTQDFCKEAEWVNALNGSRTISSAQRSGQTATNQPVLYYHSRIKSDCASATSSLAYKFKWKYQSNNQTYFSMRPYLGAQGIRTIRYAYKERESNGISRGRLNTNTINGISGLGFRIKGETADWNIKTTVSAGVTQQLNTTKVTDKIYSIDTPQGLSMDITGTGRTTVSGNFTMNFSKKDAPCKISVALQASRKAHRATQSCMLQFTHSF